MAFFLVGQSACERGRYELRQMRCKRNRPVVLVRIKFNDICANTPEQIAKRGAVRRRRTRGRSQDVGPAAEEIRIGGFSSALFFSRHGVAAYKFRVWEA